MNAFQNFTLLSVPDYAPYTMTEYGRPGVSKPLLKPLTPNLEMVNFAAMMIN